MLNRKIKPISGFISAVGLAIVLAGCQLKEPEGQFCDTLEVKMATVTDVAAAIATATNSVEMAVRRIDDTSVLSALNSAAFNGVTVELLLDHDASNTTTGINPSVNLKYGNKYGILDSNFFIVDGQMIYQLSTAYVGDGEFIMIKMYDKEMMQDYEAEFSQMFDDANFGSGSDVEDAKIRVNFHETYNIGNDTVGVYFIPEQPANNQFYSYISTADSSVYWVANYIENQELYALWGDLIESSLSLDLGIRLGGGCLDNIALYPNLMGISGNKSVYTNRLKYNALFIDQETFAQKAIITSYELTNHRELMLMDGVCVTLNGPSVASLYTQVEAANATKTETNFAVIPYSITTELQYTNVIINEYIRRGMVDGNNDDQALMKMIELKNITSSPVDLSGCKVIITNENRVAEPNMLTIPYGTVVQAGGFFVMVSKSTTFKYYDYLWQDFYIDNMYTISLVAPDGTLIDYIGSIDHTETSTEWDFWRGEYGVSLQRIPGTAGTNQADWNSYSGASVNLFDSFMTYNHVTPGAD